MNKYTRGGIFLVLSLFTMLTLAACQGKIVQNRYSADYLELFNTVSRVIGYAKNEEEFQKQSEFIHSRLKFYHEQYNAFEGYDHLNNIYTINENAGIGPVKVDDSIIDMLEYGQEVYDETGGRVNILMGSVTILAKDSGKADAYSTALFIMSLEEGKEFIRQKDAEAMWVLADGTVEYSEGFRSYEKP